MFNKVETEIGGKNISIETGKIAKQASGSVVIRSGDTIVLVTVVGAGKSKPDADFLPLTIEYQEKLASVGRIPGNYFRREIGRSSDNEILTCRIIDRPLRPLFPKGYSAETQVIATVLSADQNIQPDILALTGASCALTISNVPFSGPVAGGRVGFINGQYVINPTVAELTKSSMDIVVACTRKAVVMVEGKVDELSEDEVLSGIFYAFEQLQPLIDMQEELQKSAGKPKIAVEAPKIDESLLAKIREVAAAGMEKVFNTSDKLERGNAYDILKEEVLATLDPEGERGEEVKDLLSTYKKSFMRDKTVQGEIRIGGRKFNEIREINCETEYLPRTHGSALFTRGETQALVTTTLGSERDKQRVETLGGEQLNRFMLHYNFPPYCVGEARFLRGPSRRDIGHGTLATRGLEAVLPSEADFPYSIRVVSEVLESNGSSSMATVCGGSMAMMDAGVPLKRPVSKLSFFLISLAMRIISAIWTSR
jgi:polyribonucleotide nucleotidyltransferase